MKKKISKIQIFRLFTQIVFLILYPGLFALAFSQLGKIYTMIIRGQFNFIQAFPGIVEALTLIITTIILGRFFCGWFCAFGAINDFIYIISKHVFKIKFKINEKLDATLKYFKYVILVFTIIFMWTIGTRLFDSYSPWNAFAQIGQFPQSLFDYTIGFIILTLIAIGSVFIERFFCRYLCPLGAVFSIISRLRIFKINKPNDKCGKCRLCTNNCAMGIQLYNVNTVKSGECINCFKCIENCPRKNVQPSIADENLSPALASSIAIATFIGLYSVNNMAGTAIKNSDSSTEYVQSTNSISAVNNFANNSPSTSDSTISTPPVNNSTASAPKVSNSQSSTQSMQYKDGTYTGTGNGFRPGLQVEVTVKNDKITKVQIVTINDTPQYYSEPVSLIPKEIIKAQSTTVDAVSGATRTSNGIIMAVEDALSKAKL